MGNDADGRLSRLYEKEYFLGREPSADSRREVSYAQEIDIIRSLFPVNAGTILDVGCGNGHFMDFFEGAGWIKYGIEISEYARNIAVERGIRMTDFNKLGNEKFDLIILRGVFQHLDQPLRQLSILTSSLKIGGLICFLATPNTNSLCYKLFNNLPMLDEKRNFFVPSDIQLKNILSNLNYRIVKTRYPYWGSPYASPFVDHIKFFLHLIGVKTEFAFWRNVMEIYAKKEA